MTIQLTEKFIGLGTREHSRVRRNPTGQTQSFAFHLSADLLNIRKEHVVATKASHSRTGWPQKIHTLKEPRTFPGCKVTVNHEHITN